jgi:hypothetical protein
MAVLLHVSGQPEPSGGQGDDGGLPVRDRRDDRRIEVEMSVVIAIVSDRPGSVTLALATCCIRPRGNTG